MYKFYIYHDAGLNYKHFLIAICISFYKKNTWNRFDGKIQQEIVSFSLSYLINTYNKLRWNEWMNH